MNILICGVSGFIGSHFLIKCLENNHKVGLILRDDSNSYRISNNIKNCSLFKWQGQFDNTLAKELTEFEPDVWVHLAWKGVENSFRNESLQSIDNLGQINASLLLAKESGCEHYVGLGSQAEYGTKNQRITELDLTEPTTSYGKAKLASRWLVDSFCSAENISWTWMRVFSTYGPRDNGSWLIPYLIKALKADEEIKVTACEQMWDYLYVEDAAEAILKTVEKNAHGVFNLASGHPVRLRTIVEILRDRINKKANINFGAKELRPDQIMHLEGDITKLSAAINWTPMVDIHEGLSRTIN